MDRVDLLAEVFRSSVAQNFSDSQLYTKFAIGISDDVDILEIAEHANPGQHPPHLLFAAVHYLMHTYTNTALAACYPTITNPPRATACPYGLFRDFVLSHRDEIISLIASSHVNKTMITRSACLRALLVDVARKYEWGQINLVDVGCGAGLNLLMDKWEIHYSGYGVVGYIDDSICFTVDTHADTNIPLGAMPTILSRTGIDIDHINLSDESHVRWLLSFLMPEQTDLYNLTKSAIYIVAGNMPNIVVGDVATTLSKVLSGIPGNAPIIVMHSMSLNNLRQRQRQAMFGAINQASNTRPIITIGMEIVAGETLLSVRHPYVSDVMILGKTDEDVNWMHWY